MPLHTIKKKEKREILYAIKEKVLQTIKKYKDLIHYKNKVNFVIKEVTLHTRKKGRGFICHQIQ